jgi:hypothetical protein
MQGQLITYANSFQVITISGQIESNCNAITFINTGDDNVMVNGYTLLPTYSLYLPGHIGEQDETRYNCQFAGVGTAPGLLVIRKCY